MTLSLQPGDAGPFQTERDARAAAHAAMAPEAGWSILRSPQNRLLLEEACKAAGVELGAYDAQILGWLAGFEDSTCSAVAGLVTRAAAGTPARNIQHPPAPGETPNVPASPGPHAVVYDLAADDQGTTYFVLTEALEEFAARQRDQAETEGGSEARDRWAARADAMRDQAEAAIDGGTPDTGSGGRELAGALPWVMADDKSHWRTELPDGRTAVIRRVLGEDGSSSLLFMPAVYESATDFVTRPECSGVLAAAQWVAEQVTR